MPPLGVVGDPEEEMIDGKLFQALLWGWIIRNTSVSKKDAMKIARKAWALILWAKKTEKEAP